MDYLDDNAAPTGARNEYVLSPLWKDLFPEGLLSRLNANPFLVACRNGAVSLDQLRHFLIQHHYYSQYFTRYLCALMGSIADQGEFKSLSCNLTEELSGGDSVDISHAELYRRSMDLMSAPPRSRPLLPGTRQLIDGMFRHCRSSDPIDGLAALCLGAEAIVPLIYGPVLDALRSHNAPREAEHFFVLHIEEDEEHAIVMREIIDRMLVERPYLRARVVAIGEEMVHLRMAMLTELAQGPSAQPLGAASTLMSAEALQTLRADASLGSGNFLDRCLALSTTPDEPFLFLDKPLTLLRGTPISALALNDLQHHRMALAAWYLEQGVKPGDVVAVTVEDGLSPLLHYLALTSLGAAISLMNPAMPAEFGIAYMDENGFERLVTDTATLVASDFARQWRDAGRPVLDVTRAALDAAPRMPAWWPLEPEDSTLVMLSHTSGTTGLPKAVRFEHRQFFMGKRARIGRFAEGPDERFLSALPQSHSAAISHLETAILHGIPTFVLGTQQGQALRDAIQRFAPTTVAAFPRSYVLLVEGGIAHDEFPTVRRWFAMGDASHQSHIRRILEGAPQSRFIDAFGSSELGMALFRSESSLGAIAAQRCIGRPVDIAVAKVLDPLSGDEVQPGEVGLLAVRSPTVTSGYWKQPQKTVDAWRGGYFLTGDIAFCKDGEFYQIDRAVDVIDSPAGALHTLQLEEAAQQVDGVCDVTVVGVDPARSGGVGLLALVLPERGATDASAIAARVLRTLHEAAASRGALVAEGFIAVAVVSDLAFLPVGATGKVLKRHLRSVAQALLAGESGQQVQHLLRPAHRQLATAGHGL
ncbi:AMP-binding protein [Pseudomonas tohonis]|uniref:AMP-binding protein n=1 Tax=Pseudomonas tohonis TaxID=2725477 RepID=UPI0021DB1CC5|nr:AMP-binding protein [Pseudomonas tohonis]UXY53985.1 AMP-binding protein [Pseudomonas tohonis]